MSISLVEFSVFQYLSWRDDDGTDGIVKNGIALFADGAIGALVAGLELYSSSIEEALADVDFSQFYDMKRRDQIGQSVVLAFDVEWKPDFEGHYDEPTIKYLGLCDVRKWTPEGLHVQ